jgi:hypothetical protein
MSLDPATTELLKTLSQAVGVLVTGLVSGIAIMKKISNGSRAEIVERRDDTVRKSDYDSCRTEWKREFHDIKADMKEDTNRIYDKMTEGFNRVSDQITDLK